MVVTIELPEEIELRLQSTPAEMQRHAREGFLAEAFRCGKLSSDEVAQALGMESRWDAITFLSERGVYPGYDLEDLNADRESLPSLSPIVR